MKKVLAAFLAMAAAFVQPSLALAWNSSGHEQIADLAWLKLNSKAKAKILAILSGGDPKFAPHGQSETNLRTAFRNAATFPDYIKRHSDTIYETEIPAFNHMWSPETDPAVPAKEKQRCKTWHYYDTPLNAAGSPPIAKSNGIAALNQAISQLKLLEAAPHPDRRKEFWQLCWIEHLVGDLHQPLHCAQNFKSGQPDGGGNSFKLGIHDPDYPNDWMSLHSYWDAGIDHAKKAESAGSVTVVSQTWMNDPAFAPSGAETVNHDAVKWVKSGASLAVSAAYQGIQPAGVPTADYNQRQNRTCKRQAILAGCRLASILNSILGK